MKLFSGIVSFAELIIDSAETISIISRDLKEFLDSDSDEIPNSLKQLAKITRWMNLLNDDKCRELLADCMEKFTSSVVSVYIEKTVGINTYDQIFSGLTNPKHRDSARDVLVSVCNGALETFMRTSHEVFTSSSEKSDSSLRKSNNREDSGNGWAEALSTTIAVPSNRKFMFDVTGRVTLETMRSILEFVILKTSQSFKRSLDVIHEEVTERVMQRDIWKYSKYLLSLSFN